MVMLPCRLPEPSAENYRRKPEQVVGRKVMKPSVHRNVCTSEGLREVQRQKSIQANSSEHTENNYSAFDLP